MTHEFANVVALEAATGTTGSGNAQDGMVTPPMIATGSNDMIFGFAITFTTAAGTGFTLLSSDAANLTEERLVDAPGTYEAVATDLASNDSRWTLLGAVFRGP